MEVWKDIDDSYEVSSYGRIRSKDRKITKPYRNGFNQGHVSDCCLGKRHTHKGYIWRYSPMN